MSLGIAIILAFEKAWPGLSPATLEFTPEIQDYGATVPRERPPETLQLHPLPTKDSRYNSQDFTGVEHILPIWPVATLRPVTKGAVASLATAKGAVATCATGAANAVTGAVRAAIGAVTIENGLAESFQYP